MADEDTRSLPTAAQAALRNRAIRAVLDGMTQAEAARLFRVYPNAVNRWINATERAAGQGLLSSVAARRPGEQAALTQLQHQELIALVRGSTPISLV
jgi:transposase